MAPNRKRTFGYPKVRFYIYGKRYVSYATNSTAGFSGAVCIRRLYWAELAAVPLDTGAWVSSGWGMEYTCPYAIAYRRACSGTGRHPVGVHSCPPGLGFVWSVCFQGHFFQSFWEQSPKEHGRINLLPERQRWGTGFCDASYRSGLRKLVQFGQTWCFV